MCMVDGGDSPSVSTTRIARARKAYTCYDCGRSIAPGEKYSRNFMVYDGDAMTHMLCAHCQAAADLLVEHCGGFLYGGIHEDLEEHISEALPWSRAAARAVIGMRRRWATFRDKSALMPVPDFLKGQHRA